MKINENILLELDKNISDYFVVTKSISEKMISMEQLEKKHLEARLANKVDKEALSQLKKDTYLYQFYNVFLVKIISNIRLLYKLVKVNDIELNNEELEKQVQHIIESDPETLAVDNGEILIIDDTLKDVIENKLSEVSKDELKNILKEDTKNEEGK